MITHNGTYLLHATHHGMPIYAATMGGKMVIGWLQSATLQAIVAAFGAEGTAVIAKTNDYLNRIATTDPQRALLLAGFINEDPLLVCSLVETSKVRYLVGDGKAYVKLRNVGRMSDTYEMKFKYNVGGSYRAWGVFGQPSYQPTNMSLTYSSGISVRWANNGNQQIDNLAPLTSTAWHTLKIENGYVTFDGVNKGRSAGHKDGFVINYPMYLFTINPANTTPTATMNGCFEYYKHTSQEGEQVANICPFIRNGENGMLDIISGTFYPNANTEGSFTITLTDKTTS